ncbi:MAG: DNA-directed RNA polymerase subunit alpha C-terminal domain-containing protein, partial [Planctomycetota bacterium]
MNQTATGSLRDLLVNHDVDGSYYRQIRTEVFSQSLGTGELEGILKEVSGDSLKEAILHHFLGNRTQALELMKKASKDSPWSAYLRGTWLLEAGSGPEAQAALEEGAQEHSGHSFYGPLLVETRVLNGDLEGARKQLDTVDLPMKDPLRMYLNGLIQEREGDYEEALESYEKAASACPEETRYQFRLAYLHSLHGDDESALAAYEMCQRSAPVYARALLNLGILYEDLGRYEDAMTCYDMVLQANPHHERAKMYLEDAEASLDMYYDREKEKEHSRRNQLLQIPISDFELSVRSRNCLSKMNIHTLGDLIKKTEAELLSYKNFGETSLAEIKKILVQKCFRLGQGLEEERRRSTHQLPDSEQARLLNQPVSVLELSSRSQRCMDRLGIESLADLLKRTELELISQKNFGVTSLHEVKRK